MSHTDTYIDHLLFKRRVYTNIGITDIIFITESKLRSLNTKDNFNNTFLKCKLRKILPMQ